MSSSLEDNSAITSTSTYSFETAGTAVQLSHSFHYRYQTYLTWEQAMMLTYQKTLNLLQNCGKQIV